jgi:DNA-binding IclR family transcriptional regulator
MLEKQQSSYTHSASGVQVIKRVAAILRVVKTAPIGLSVAELAKIVELPRSTVYRIVKTLADDDFLTVGPGRQGVRLGPELGELWMTAHRSLGDIAKPHMHNMAQSVNETVDLALWQSDHVRFIGQVRGNQRLRAEVIVGESFPAFCTANGKAFLAELSTASLKNYFANVTLARFTPNTITSRIKLAKELDDVRANGFAFDREEHTGLICAVGAVVHDVRDGDFAAITIAAPAQRFYGREDQLVKTLLEGKRCIEEALARS